MDLREQIARALAEVEHGEGTWEHLADGWHRRYLALAQAVLPFIAAERERCAGVAAGPYPTNSKYDERSPYYGSDLNPDRSEFGRGKQSGRQEAAAAIRSQP